MTHPLPRSARLAGTAVIAAAASVAAGVGPASTGERPGCDPKGSRTVSETSNARVFTRVVRGTPRIYGCWFDHGKPYLLRSRAVGDDRRGRLAGRYVAYPWYGRDDSVKLRVFDLRRGRLIRTAATYPDSSSVFFLESFVVNDRGSVAWIVLKSVRSSPSVSVHRWDSNGLARLHEDVRIHPQSLAIAADTRSDSDIIYWLVLEGAGEPRWATLD